MTFLGWCVGCVTAGLIGHAVWPDAPGAAVVGVILAAGFVGACLGSLLGE